MKKRTAERSRQDEQDKLARLSISSKLEDRLWRQKVNHEAYSHTSFGINFVCVDPGEFGRSSTRGLHHSCPMPGATAERPDMLLELYLNVARSISQNEVVDCQKEGYVEDFPCKVSFNKERKKKDCFRGKINCLYHSPPAQFPQNSQFD